MKKIVVVTYSKNAADEFCQVLQSIFKDKVIVEKYSIEENTIRATIEADLVVISVYKLYKQVEHYIPSNVQIILPNFTILKDKFQRILDIPPETIALLVSVNVDLSMQCIKQIYHMGARHIELIPYSSYLGNAGDIDIAITPGEEHNVPASIKRVINIGTRAMDISTIINILIHFKMEFLFNTPETIEYFQKIMPFNFDPSLFAKKNLFCVNEFVMANYKSGVIGFTPGGTIMNCNYMAEKILDYKSDTVIGKSILSLFSQPLLQEAIKNIKPFQEKQIRINGQDILVEISIENDGNTQICYLTLEPVYKFVRKPSIYQKQIIGRGYVAKYNFKDFVTKNEKMISLKAISERNAKTDSSIFITGESGTGKEILSQAIHNASKRQANPFVAINCAAVAESLLESELFGYDKGAFTGASRTGKKGLFELAHSGTLFLDEIGEMPFHLQARLLRVLQEKEIIRVGGDRVISVDVRIIAATNQNVINMIKDKTFRKDLYYRLNVIPLTIPPLRKRKEDVPLLIEVFQKQFHTYFKITPGAMERLQNHPWEGNIRELQNLIEYLRNLRKPIVAVEDLPFVSDEEKKANRLNNTERETIKKLEQTAKQDTSKIVFILEALKTSKEEHTILGRRSLAALSRLNHLNISEIQMRTILSDLVTYQMIKQKKGRGGTAITKLGLKAFDYYKVKQEKE